MCSLEELDHDGISGHAGADAAEERLIFGQHAFGLWRDEHWRAESLHERPDGTCVGLWIEVEAKDHDRPARGTEGLSDSIERRRMIRHPLRGSMHDGRC